jgi:alpha-ribazole phosphatase
MTGKERRPIADAYWAEALIDKRMGVAADAFTEFIDRVGKFISQMHTMPDRTVIFVHGIWFGLLVWKLMGFDVTDSQTMKAFRRFQSGLPLCNGATYKLQSETWDTWSAQAIQELFMAVNTLSLAYSGSIIYN